MEIPIEVIIEIFEKINLSDYKTITTISKINKKFNFVYKKYFEKKVLNSTHFGKKVTVNIPRFGNLFYGIYLNINLPNL